MITIYVQKTQARAELDTPLTNGSVGLEVQFNFSPDWDGLSRTAVFETSEYYKETVEIENENTAIVPENVMLQSGVKLYIGVYGTDNEGNIVVPTVYADCGEIKRGANTEPGGTPVNPSQAVMLQNQIDDLDSRVDVLEMSGVGGAGANVFVGDENTTSAEFYSAFAEKKPCFMMRPNAGAGMVMWVAHDCTSRAARFYNVTPDGTVRYATLEGLVFSYESAAGGSGNVFVGDENTTVSEFYEAYQAGKVCFMKRASGPSGTVTWVSYNCTQYYAFFYHVTNGGAVMYARLSEDGTWTINRAFSDVVKSVNGITPDLSGKVTLPIPTTLPNPHKLTFSGAVNAEYDGSEAVEVVIPQGGGGEEWRLFKTVTIDGDTVTQIEVTTDDDGNDFAFSEVTIGNAVASATGTESSAVNLRVNDKNSDLTLTNFIRANGAYISVGISAKPMYTEVLYSSTDNYLSVNKLALAGAVRGQTDYKVKSLKMTVSSADVYFANGLTLYFYGR